MSDLTLLLTSNDQEWQFHITTDILRGQEWQFHTKLLTSSGQEWQFDIATDI